MAERVVPPVVGTVVAVVIGLTILLWIITALRRRALRSYLMAVGAETTGTASLVRRARKRYPVIVVKYTDNDGVVHSAQKSVVSAGDDALVKKTARVIYHPGHPSRDDYVLLGFGATPNKWFRAHFTRSTAK